MTRFRPPRHFLGVLALLGLLLLVAFWVLGLSDNYRGPALWPTYGLAGGLLLLLGWGAWHLTQSWEHQALAEARLLTLNSALESEVTARTAALHQKVQELGLARLQLSDSHDTLRSILNTSPDGFWRTDGQGHLIDVNPAYCAQSGYTRDELLGMQIADLDATATPEDVAARIERLRRQGHDKFEVAHRRKDGTFWFAEVSAMCQREDGAEMFAFLRDITLQKEHQSALEKVAHYDPLTQLPNRNLLADRLSQNLARGQRSGELIAVCMLDLDGFKQINDQLGHKAGDQLLTEVAQRLRTCLRHEDTAARLGGDEFVLLLGGLASVAECHLALDRVLASIAAPYQLLGQIAHISGSIGVSIFPTEGSDPDVLLRQADKAMYSAKKAGKNRYQLFDPSYELHNKARSSTVLKIAKAIAHGQFEMVYQPKVNVRLGTVVGVEALVRWRHPILGLMAPAEFVPIIEQEDLVVAVGEWVIQTVLHQQAAWLACGTTLPVSLNIASRHMLSTGFAQHLRLVLAEHPPALAEHITLDVTESVALEDVNAVAHTIDACRHLGVQVALDDFGTGFSSLMHIKRLAVDELKIDKSFVATMLDGPQDLAIVQSVIGLGAAFRRKVSAEGVESLDQLLMLLEMGCDVMQGYYLARPMAAADLLQWQQTFEPDPLWQLSLATRPSRDYFELLLTQTNHRLWVDRLMDHARSQDDDLATQALLRADQCRFGRWYQTAGRAHFKNQPEFEAIGVLHQAIHDRAAELCQHQHPDQTETSGSDERQLREMHTAMLSLLGRLQDASLILAPNLPTAQTGENHAESRPHRVE